MFNKEPQLYDYDALHCTCFYAPSPFHKVAKVFMKSYYNFINMSKTSHDNSLTIFFFHEQGCQNEIITHRTVLFTYSNIYMQQHFIIKCNYLSFDFTLRDIFYEIQRKAKMNHSILTCLYEFRKCLTPYLSKFIWSNALSNKWYSFQDTLILAQTQLARIFLLRLDILFF